MDHSLKVMKFGGSSVQDAEHIKLVCSIILEEKKKQPVAAVFSAMKGITDQLIKTAHLAESGDLRYRAELEEIVRRERLTAKALLPGDHAVPELESMLENLQDVLHGIELVKECSPRTMDLVMSFGERMNCFLICSYLKSLGERAVFLDTRRVLVTNDRHTSAEVDFSATNKNMHTWGSGLGSEDLPVITGFIAATEDGVTTTLGRNGSDYTASIVGAALGASCVEIWTDVDGVMSADPRIVSSAFVIPKISVQEAMELSYFGAEVIHPYTMLPAVKTEIPIVIRNTLNPSAPGTVIAKETDQSGKPITGIASIKNVSILNIEGGGMLGVPGIAGRVFSCLAKAGVNIIMISQASSEHSICLVCRSVEVRTAVAALREELRHELHSNIVDRIDLQEGMEIVAIVGDNMRGIPGISGRLFNAIGDKKINIQAIAQGSSERNISFVIHKEDTETVLNTVHRAFLE